MPNWCSNGLIVTGPKKDLDAFKATLNSPDPDQKGAVVPFSFAQTVPPPANMFRGNLGDNERVACADKGIPTWLDWQITNWGCKWDACEAQTKNSPKSVKIVFDTPWAPPLPWLKACAAKFPKLNFEMGYCEGGMSFYGVAIATDGGFFDNGQDIPDNCMTDSGNAKGVLKKHVVKYGIGTGG